MHKKKYKNNTCQVINLITHETVVSAKTMTYETISPQFRKNFSYKQKKVVPFKGKSFMTNYTVLCITPNGNVITNINSALLLFIIVTTIVTYPIGSINTNPIIQTPTLW